jgi:hypothetical protein
MLWFVRGVSSDARPNLPPTSEDASVGEYKLSVLPKDSREVLRVVGFYEYAMALQQLEKLAALVKDEELKAFDELIKERDELAVFTNVSRQVPHPRSSLDEAPLQQGDTFERRGFAWVTALARVELGAMLATHTEAQQPFVSVAGAGFDRREFTELLQDGMRSHYWALANDRNIKNVLRKRPDETTLNYIRRLVMAQAFLQAAVQIAASSYGQVQLAELKSWKKNLDELQGTLIVHVQSYLETVTNPDAFTQACGAACAKLQARGGG